MACSSTTSTTRLFEAAHHVKIYQQYRPELPQEVIQRGVDFLLEKKSKPFQLAVDVGCGSGQSTRHLAQHFEKVIGVDVSEEQIRAAQGADHPKNVEFKIGSGEDIPVPDSSTDLVTCSEAVHWFDLDAFFREVDRILKPNGCVVISSYYIMLPWIEGDDLLNQQLKEIITKFYEVTLGPYTSDRSHIVQKLLAGVHIPYAESVRDESLKMSQHATMTTFIGYMSSWSGYQSYIKENTDGPDILKKIQDRLMAVIGVDTPPESTKLHLTCPVTMLLGRKPEPQSGGN